MRTAVERGEVGDFVRMDLEDSLDRVFKESNQKLGEIFYDTMISKHTDIAPFFKNVNLRYQAAILLTALEGALIYYQSRADYHRRFLVSLGHRHFKDLNVPRELYPKFTDTLLEVVREYAGEEWNLELERQWCEALELAVHTMHEGYVDKLPAN